MKAKTNIVVEMKKIANISSRMTLKTVKIIVLLGQSTV